MSRVYFSDDKVMALAKAVGRAENEMLFLSAADFWKRFGVTDTAQATKAQLVERLGAIGVEAAFEAMLSRVPDLEVPAVSGDSGDEAEGAGDFSQEVMEAVVNSVAEAEDEMLFLDAADFWAHFGLPNPMRALEAEARRKLAERGVDLSFEVVLTFAEAELPLLGDFAAPAQPAPLDLNGETVRSLSIRQPWAELILRGEKNLEYRSRRMKEMGPLLVHASRTLDPDLFEGRDLDPETLTFGALVGLVDVVGCTEVEGQEGLYAYQLAHPRRFKTPVPYSGAAGIFRVPVAEVRAALAGGIELAPRRSDTLEQ